MFLKFKSENLQAGTLKYTGGSLMMLFAWLYMADFVLMMRERAVTPTTIQLLLYHHASPAMIVLLKDVLPNVLSFVIVIPLCYISDRWRGRMGRRIPFLLLATPLAVIGMIVLAYTPELGHHLHNFLGNRSPGLDPCSLIMFTFGWLLFEVGAMLTMTLFPALINDVVPKGVLGRFYGAFRVISLASGIVFMMWMITYTNTHRKEIYLVLAALFGVGFMLLCWRVKEGTYPPPEQIGKDGTGGLVANIRHFLVDSFSQRYYWWIYAFLIFAGMTGLYAIPFNAVSQMYSNSLNIPIETYGKVTACAWALGMLVALVVGWLVDRMGVFLMASVTLALYSVTAISGYFLINGQTSFLWVYGLHVVFSGAYITSVSPLLLVLFPQMKYSQFASALGIVNIPVGIIFGSLLATIMNYADDKFRLTLLIVFVCSIVGLILLMVVWRNYRKRQELLSI